MRGLRRSFLASASLIAFSANLTAGEWSGFYAGINLGVTGRKAEFTELGDAGGNGANGPVGTVFTAPRGAGATAGGQLGYNWQFANFVYGIETDFNLANGKSRDELTRSSLGALTTLRGRMGFALPSTLIYLTAGLSSGRIENSLNQNNFVSDGWRTGWVVGSGIEYLFASNKSLRFEGLHSDFGSWTVTGPEGCTGGRYRSRFSHSESTVRAALNFKW